MNTHVVLSYSPCQSVPRVEVRGAKSFHKSKILTLSKCMKHSQRLFLHFNAYRITLNLLVHTHAK
jgi:hypothetical protein